MQFHASCAARLHSQGFEAVLLRGPPGSGKSDLLLRLLNRGFSLVADDQVLVEDGMARAPAAIAGLLEVRGLGLFRLNYVEAARLVLIVRVGVAAVRLPEPVRDPELGLPVVTVDPAAASAPDRVNVAMDAVCGRAGQIAGAFAL